MEIKISTDLASYDSFWDWFVHVRNPFNEENGHFHWEPTFFSNELEFYLLAILTFTHAYRHGSRYLWLWFAILWHGYTVELVSYWFETIDNFWHAQSTLMFFGRREPFQIVLVYPSYLYCAAIVVERMNVSELTQACTMALMVVILDFPYDIMGIKNLWWTWHDTDSNLFDRNYWVPITSYYFHATFASSFSLIYNKARRYFVGLSGVYGEDDLHHSGISFGRRAFMAGNWRGEFKAAACAGLFSMPVGILQFVPLFHYFRDVHHLHAEPTMIALGGIYLLIAFYGVNRAKPRNLLEEGEREEKKGTKRFGNGRWYYDEIVAAVLIHFFHYMLLVTFANPKSYQVFGLHQTMGSEAGSGDEFDCASTRNVTYPYPFTPAAFPWFLKSNVFQNVTVSKRPYLCPFGKELFDEGVFNFECEKGRNQPWIPGNKFYWICGTDWNNDNKGPETSHAEYIFVIYTCCILGIHALVQPLIYPRTVFEQFFVKREFPKYWKYDKPSNYSRTERRGGDEEEEDECDRYGGRIVDVSPNTVSGETEVHLRKRAKNASTLVISKEEFIAMPLGRMYAERGGEYGGLHDTYNKSSIDRLRTFISLQSATTRLNIFNERAGVKKTTKGKKTKTKVTGIDYSLGYPRPAVEEEEEE